MQVYILGVSHVSRESCQEIQDLIQTVRPEVVILELCKDRLRLLLDQVWQALQLTLNAHLRKLLPSHKERLMASSAAVTKGPGSGTT